MKSSPLTIVRLSVLFISIISTVSCSKNHDLMAEYVVSASIIPNEMGMSAMDDSIGKDANGNPILDTFFEESGTGEGQFTEAASTTASTVEIDDVTNTIIYTPAVSKGIEAN